MISSTSTKTTVAQAVAVAGPDIDPSLAAKLTPGDKVMVEMNGARIYSRLSCPLVAEFPWEVISNDPPQLGSKPTEDHKLVLKHRMNKHPMTLHYAHLLHLAPRQPAIFLERDAELSCNADGIGNNVYVILQLVSHYMPASEVRGTFDPHDREMARMILEDHDLRGEVFIEWAGLFRGFAKPGWTNKSVFRLAMRAFVSPQIIDAFQQENWEVIGGLDTHTLTRIHTALHWLPYYLQAAPLAAERQTLGEDENKDAMSL